MRADLAWLTSLLWLVSTFCCCPGFVLNLLTLAPATTQGQGWVEAVLAVAAVLLQILVVRRLLVRPRFAVTDAGGGPLAAFAATDFLRRRFLLEVRGPGLEPDLAIALGMVVAMDPSGTL